MMVQSEAAKFKKFCQMNVHIRHVQTAPYQPLSNWLVEWVVQVFKQGIRKASTSNALLVYSW